MIGYLQGEILKKLEGKFLIGIGNSEQGRVGYLVAIPDRPEYHHFKLGSKIELYTHYFVREDGIELFGFLRELEKELFLALLTVSGVGPRSGLSILSVLNPEEVISSILKNKPSNLTRAHGIGKKAAERMVLELKEKFQTTQWSGFLKNSVSAQPSPPETWIEDAQSALIYLGYKEPEAKKLVNLALKRADSVPSSEALVKLALQERN